MIEPPVEYALTDELPVRPQLYRSFNWLIQSICFTNASSSSFQANAAEGKNSHLLPSASTEAPSQRPVNVTRKRSSRP
ncbi:hypothetical protein D3C87_1710880 [compost metagenome]